MMYVLGAKGVCARCQEVGISRQVWCLVDWPLHHQGGVPKQFSSIEEPWWFRVFRFVPMVVDVKNIKCDRIEGNSCWSFLGIHAVVVNQNLWGFSPMPSECSEDLGSRQRRRTMSFKSFGVCKCSSLRLWCLVNGGQSSNSGELKGRWVWVRWG